ncbi:MAG: sensor histidine kinase [Thermosynechococcaceae cyanobacterium]
MHQPFPNPPRQFLTYLEWTLLGIVAISEVIDSPLANVQRLPLLNFICIAGFAALGLKLPRKATVLLKVVYSLTELSLIGVAAGIGGLRLISMLFVVFVVRNALLWEKPSRHGFTIIAFVGFTLLQHQRLRSLFLNALSPELAGNIQGIVWSVVLLVGLVLIFLQLLLDAWLSDYRSRCQLEAANTQLRQYALRIEDLATLQERNRIAREIHDALGHSLTALNLHLQAAHKLWIKDPAEAQVLLQEAETLGRIALEEVRQSVGTLRTDPVQGQSIEMAIAPLIASLQKSTGISPTVTIQLPGPVPNDIGAALYRIVQEALTNIAKYAEAKTVEIAIAHSRPGTLELCIRDDGQGFDPAQNTTGFGLQGMKERTVALGGRLTINSAPGQGCQIQALIPLPLEENLL